MGGSVDCKGDVDDSRNVGDTRWYLTRGSDGTFDWIKNGLKRREHVTNRTTLKLIYPPPIQKDREDEKALPYCT